MLNSVNIIGRIATDTELKNTSAGKSCLSFRVAVERDYIKPGEERISDFFNIIAYGSIAEFIDNNFSKGSMIGITGRLESSQFTSKEGNNRTMISIKVISVSFTGEKKDKYIS